MRSAHRNPSCDESLRVRDANVFRRRCAEAAGSGSFARHQDFRREALPAETMRALVARFSRGLGREIKLLTMPRPLLKVLALAVPFIPGNRRNVVLVGGTVPD